MAQPADRQVEDRYIPTDTFREIVRWVPRVSVELVLEHDGSVLLAQRENRPAKGEWFWPGSRLYKNATFEAAAHRVARDELGIAVDLCCRIGTYSHFWDSSKFVDVDGTHTVNIVFHATPAENVDNIALDDQHSDYKFVDSIAPWMHAYVKQYLNDSGLLSGDCPSSTAD